MANSPAYLGGLGQTSRACRVGGYSKTIWAATIAALHPTLGLACGKTNSSNRASAATRACND